MPYAVTHVLSSIIGVDLYRDYVTKHKHLFTIHTLFLAGLGGLLPDIDVPLNWVIGALGVKSSLFAHGGITHTPLFALPFFLIGIFLFYRKNHKTAMYFFVITFGIMLHLFLDYLLGGGAGEGVMWLYPFSTTAFKIHLFPMLGFPGYAAALDAVLLLLWIWHEEHKHKIRDFI